MAMQLYNNPTATATHDYEQVAQNAHLFITTLEDLHTSLGNKFVVPTLGGKPLDLHRLFVEVTARGGLQKVINNRQWREIISVFSFPSTLTNASFVLRKYYMSLLHQYEQVYFFRKEIQSSTVHVQATTLPIEEKDTNATSCQLWAGCSVMGAIDGKFDNGYLITVCFGSEKLQGVLYHVPHESQKLCNLNSSIVTHRRRRRRSRLASKDPSHPRRVRTGYNFFYSEHYARLKSLHHGQEKNLSSMVANLWSKLSEAEKQVYQEKGLRDKERHHSEMMEYGKSSDHAGISREMIERQGEVP